MEIEKNEYIDDNEIPEDYKDYNLDISKKYNKYYISNRGRTFFDYYLKYFEDENIVKHIIGFAVYFVIFVVTIPVLLYKNSYFNVLEAYLPNVDLVANLISFNGQKYFSEYFKELYVPSPTTMYAFLSQSFINYFALLGVTYIIASESVKTRNIFEGWSMGFVMLLMTYLLPSPFISDVMERINRVLVDDPKFKWIYNAGANTNWYLSMFAGLMLTIGIILLEGNVIKALRSKLIWLGKFIVSFPDRF